MGVENVKEFVHGRNEWKVARRGVLLLVSFLVDVHSMMLFI